MEAANGKHNDNNNSFFLIEIKCATLKCIILLLTVYTIYNIILLAANCSLFQRMIGYKKYYFRDSNKIIFTYKTLYHTEYKVLYSFVLEFYTHLRDRKALFEFFR